MRISDWSSDVCSSDLRDIEQFVLDARKQHVPVALEPADFYFGEAMRLVRENHAEAFDIDGLATMVGVTADTLRKGFRTCLGVTVKEYIQSVRLEIGRAACRERVCQYV